MQFLALPYPVYPPLNRLSIESWVYAIRPRWKVRILPMTQTQLVVAELK